MRNAYDCFNKRELFQVEQISVGKSFVLDVKNVRVALTISMLIKPDLLWAKLYFESLGKPLSEVKISQSKAFLSFLLRCLAMMMVVVVMGLQT